MTLLRVPTSTKGTVIDVQVFTRDGLKKDQRALEIEKQQLDEFRKDLNEEFRIVETAAFDRLRPGLRVRSAPDDRPLRPHPPADGRLPDRSAGLVGRRRALRR